MNEKVVKFEPVTVGENFRFDGDEILEAAKGNNFETLVILGVCEDGSLYIASTANAGEALILMEQAKHQIIFGED